MAKKQAPTKASDPIEQARAALEDDKKRREDEAVQALHAWQQKYRVMLVVPIGNELMKLPLVVKALE